MLIYKYNDSSLFFAETILRKVMNRDYVYVDFNYNFDTLSNLLLRLLSPTGNIVFIYYFLVCITLVSSFILSFFLFKHLKIEKPLSIVFSGLYAFSLYYIYRVVSFTPALMFTGVFPLLFYVLIKYESYSLKNNVIKALVLFFIFLVSNYYGFFALVIFALMSSFDVIKKHNKKSVLNVVVPLVLYIGLVLLFFSRIVLANMFLTSNYAKPKVSELGKGNNVIYRPLEDFYSFSYRPWYIFIPPTSSVFLGSVSEAAYSSLQNTQYYLADDYSVDEMAGTFLGYHFILGLVFVSVLIINSHAIWTKKFIFVNANKALILKLLCIIIILLTITGPPSFTFSGATIYTPSYLIYWVFPAIRVLVRWSVVIYLLSLLINAFVFQDLLNLLIGKYKRITFLTLFVILNLYMFSVTLPVLDLKLAESYVVYLERLGKNDPKTLVVYPKADYKSQFWIIRHKNYIKNPVNYVGHGGFDSNAYTKELNNRAGLEKLKSDGVDYFVYHKSIKVPEDGADLSKAEYLKLLQNLFGMPVYEDSNTSIYKVGD